MNIFNEDFFYNSVLCTPKENVSLIIKNKSKYYYERQITKKSGYRILNCIVKDSPLYKLQNNLKKNFLDKIEVSCNTYGFVKKHCYRDFFLPHLNLNKEEKYYLRLDIKNFFPSIKKDLLLKAIGNHIFSFDLELRKEVQRTIYEIITLYGVIPQGAITSPSISNIVFKSIDVEIQNYCEARNIIYTRYADDLLFSSINNKLEIFDDISNILRRRGFKLNKSKTIYSKNEITLSGFVIGTELGLSRKKKKEINKILFLYSQNLKEAAKDSRDKLNKSSSKSLREFINQININCANERLKFNSPNELFDYLQGYKSFLISWLPNENINSKNFNKISYMISKIDSIIIRYFPKQSFNKYSIEKVSNTYPAFLKLTYNINRDSSLKDSFNYTPRKVNENSNQYTSRLYKLLINDTKRIYNDLAYSDKWMILRYLKNCTIEQILYNDFKLIFLRRNKELILLNYFSKYRSLKNLSHYYVPFDIPYSNFHIHTAKIGNNVYTTINTYESFLSFSEITNKAANKSLNHDFFESFRNALNYKDYTLPKTYRKAVNYLENYCFEFYIIDNVIIISKFCNHR